MREKQNSGKEIDGKKLVLTQELPTLWLIFDVIFCKHTQRFAFK